MFDGFKRVGRNPHWTLVMYQIWTSQEFAVILLSRDSSRTEEAGQHVVSTVWQA
jgi:hypothetical protein